MHDYNHADVFYHVYRELSFHGAARKLHLSQPTVSSHIKEMEENLKLKFFLRKPVRRLPMADYFFEHVVSPAVERMAEFKRRLRAQSGPVLNVAASEFVLQHYVVPLLSAVERDEPGLSVTLRAGCWDQIQHWMAEKEIDLAIAVRDEPPAGFRWEPLMTLPIVLLAPNHTRMRDIDSVIALPEPHRRLICPPRNEGACRRFEAWLRQRGLNWVPSSQAGSTAMVPWMVAAGLGYGVCVGASPLFAKADMRALPIAGVAPVTVGAIWRGEQKAALLALLELVKQTAADLNRSGDQFKVG